MVVSLVALVFLGPLILVCSYMASRDTNATGIFSQERIGRNGKHFKVYKIRTMKDRKGTTITSSADDRITALGTKLRKYKLDELPQLWNVFVGDMSFVGPRPDVPGYADKLTGEEKVLLTLRPGITGPATLKYRNEEVLLSKQDDPESYNRNVIWPEKISINMSYLKEYSFYKDMKIIFQTVFGK